MRKPFAAGVLALLVEMVVLQVLFAQGAAASPVQDRFSKTCALCHINGAAGAPRAGDVAAWEPRLAKGIDALLASTRNGLRAMPPMGMCFDCTNDEFRALIEYMAAPPTRKGGL